MTHIDSVNGQKDHKYDIYDSCGKTISQAGDLKANIKSIRQDKNCPTKFNLIPKNYTFFLILI